VPLGDRRPADTASYGMYCWAIPTTRSWRTAIQNGPAPPGGSTITSLPSCTRTSLVALPVWPAVRVLQVMVASLRTGSVRSLGLTLRM
jgi:hypothetical protein